MEENDRMVAAARRLARRTAKKSDMTYQQALDHVARGAGREHWAAFMADPVEVARDLPSTVDHSPMRAQAEFLAKVLSRIPSREVPRDDLVPTMLGGEDWNMPADRREEWMLDVPFVPGWNALASRYVGVHVPVGEREAHVGRIASILLPEGLARDAYFARKGREALEGFLLAEALRSWSEMREASIPALIGWISDGLSEASRRRAPDSDGVRDGMRTFLGGVCDAIASDGRSDRALAFLTPLVDMADKERSGVLGTMDQALLPFKSAHVRAANS